MTVAAIVLAAGEGSRFRSSSGGHKLMAEFRGRPILAWAVSAALDAGFDRLYVVQGAVDVNALIRDTTTGHPRAATVVVLTNPDWAQGQAASLATGIAAAAADGHGAVVVGLGDQPLVPASAWRSVGAAAGPIVAATFDGQRRPPTKLDCTVWDQLPRTGDQGARMLIQLRPDLVSELPCTGSGFDIDTTEDLGRWS